MSFLVYTYDMELKPITVRIDAIQRFEPAMDGESTDIFLYDGEILTTPKSYDEFKISYYTAAKLNPEETWKVGESADGKIKIRYFLN